MGILLSVYPFVNLFYTFFSEFLLFVAAVSGKLGVFRFLRSHNHNPFNLHCVFCGQIKRTQTPIDAWVLLVETDGIEPLTS